MALTVLRVHFLGPIPSVEGQMVPQVMGGFTLFPRGGVRREERLVKFSAGRTDFVE